MKLLTPADTRVVSIFVKAEADDSAEGGSVDGSGSPEVITEKKQEKAGD
jgi:hypothetical protein